MSREEIEKELINITKQIRALNIEKDRLQRELKSTETQNNDNNKETTNKSVNNNLNRVSASELASRMGTVIPYKYHQFANVVRRDRKGNRLYVGDKVKIITRGHIKTQVAVVGYLTEFKVTVVFENGLKASKEAKYLEVTNPYNQKGKAL